MPQSQFFESSGVPRAIMKSTKRDCVFPDWAQQKAPGSCWFEHMPYILRLEDVRAVQGRFPAFFRLAASLKCRNMLSESTDRTGSVLLGAGTIDFTPENVYNW
jgi:hypothetical protein